MTRHKLDPIAMLAGLIAVVVLLLGLAGLVAWAFAELPAIMAVWAFLLAITVLFYALRGWQR